MQFDELPLNVLVLIFQNVESLLLSSWMTNLNNHQDNDIVRVIRAVAYSNIIVTNEWYGLLMLQPRALQIESIETLSKHLHISFDDFWSLMFDLESHIDHRIPVSRSVKFVLSTDGDSNGLRYKCIRLMAKIMRQMPAFVQPSIKQIHLKLPPITEIGDFDRKLDSLFCTNLIMCDATSKYVETFSIEAGVPAHEGFHPPWISTVESFSLFQSLKYLRLTKMGIVDLSTIQFPETLEKLVLSRNAIMLLSAIVFPRGLKDLDVSHNNIQIVNGRYLPNGLRHLIVNENEIEEIKNLPNLITYLDVSFNRVSVSDIELPEKLQALRTDLAQTFLMDDETRQVLSARNIDVLRTNGKVMI